MTDETMTASTTIDASAEAVFDVLAEPSTHQAIDGTGWVRESLDGKPISASGQLFRVAMYHDNHPAKHYEITNRVVAYDAPRVIAWEPGYDDNNDGHLSFGGWIWRYDIEQVGPSQTKVTLTYDWSATTAETREEIQFPPFEPTHLDNSLEHLSELAMSRAAR
jgi:uncharacterized protein YndB with AHSA1/START domain